MKITELREKNVEELNNLLLEKQEEARALRFDIFQKKTKNHQDFWKVKKMIAKIKTVLSEFKLPSIKL